MSTTGSPVRPSTPAINNDVPMTESIPPCRVLGVFGMSMFTRRDDLEKVFSEYGAIDRVEIISNRQTGKSKGFGFVYYERLEDAEIARLKTNGLVLNERAIRVDFSRTEAPHNPTPGFYNGKPIPEYRREHDRSRGSDLRRRDDDRSYNRGGSDRRDYDRGRYGYDRRDDDRSYRMDRRDRDERSYVPSHHVTSSSRRRSPSPTPASARDRFRSRSDSRGRRRGGDYRRDEPAARVVPRRSLSRD